MPSDDVTTISERPEELHHVIGESGRHFECGEVAPWSISVQRWTLNERSAKERGGHLVRLLPFAVFRVAGAGVLRLEEIGERGREPMSVRDLEPTTSGIASSPTRKTSGAGMRLRRAENGGVAEAGKGPVAGPNPARVVPLPTPRLL